MFHLTGFKVRKYDNNTRFSHLFSGYIKENVKEDKFPLKLQNLCMQYCGFVLMEGMSLSSIGESKLLQHDEAKVMMLNLLCYGMNNFFITKMELLYRGSRDGMKAKSFHSKCDNQGKTLVICYSNHGHLFGGYSSIPWSCDGSYHSDKDAFLYVLKSNFLNDSDYIDYGGQIFKTKPGEEKHAVLHYKEYGPVFGYGHDLALFSLADNNVDTQSCCKSYSFTSQQLIGGWMYCQIFECEVYRIYTNND